MQLLYLADDAAGFHLRLTAASGGADAQHDAAIAPLLPNSE